MLYVTDGEWGAGTGVPLAAAEVDEPRDARVHILARREVQRVTRNAYRPVVVRAVAVEVRVAGDLHRRPEDKNFVFGAQRLMRAWIEDTQSAAMHARDLHPVILPRR